MGESDNNIEETKDLSTRPLPRVEIGTRRSDSSGESTAADGFKPPVGMASGAPRSELDGREEHRCDVRWHGVVITVLSAALAVVTLLGVGAVIAVNHTIRQYGDTISRYNEAVEKFNDLEPELKETLEHANDAANSYEQFKSDASGAGKKAAQSLAEAKQGLLDSIDRANQWLDSEEGQQTKESVRVGLRALLTAGQKVIDESGVTDPQTYENASDAIDQWLQRMQQ